MLECVSWTIKETNKKTVNQQNAYFFNIIKMSSDLVKWVSCCGITGQGVY